MPVRSTVEATIIAVAGERNRALQPLTDNLNLLDSGLDSLCLAVIVAQLEDSLGVDPFSTSEDGALPVTVGEFIKLYEDAIH